MYGIQRNKFKGFIMANRILIVDTEATGLEKEAQATEIGWVECIFDTNNNGELTPTNNAYAMLCKPELPIGYGAMAVTHIYYEDVHDKPPHSQVIPSVIDNTVGYIIGHNIDFDDNIIRNAGVDTSHIKKIDTLAMVRTLYPKADNHQLTTILHMVDYDYAREHSRKAHSAKHDVIFTYRLLRLICLEHNIQDIESLYSFSEQCRVHKYMPFGEHKGEPLDEIDGSYKEYILSKQLEKVEEERDIYLVKALQNSIASDLANNTNLPLVMPITKFKGETLVDMVKDPLARKTLQWIVSDKFSGSELLKRACSATLNNYFSKTSKG